MCAPAHEYCVSKLFEDVWKHPDDKPKWKSICELWEQIQSTITMETFHESNENRTSFENYIHNSEAQSRLQRIYEKIEEVLDIDGE